MGLQSQTRLSGCTELNWVSNSWQPYGLQPASFLCPWDLQARILGWVAIPSSRDLPNPGIKLTSRMSPALAGGFFTTSTICEAWDIIAGLLKGWKGLNYEDQILQRIWEFTWHPQTEKFLILFSLLIKLAQLGNSSCWHRKYWEISQQNKERQIQITNFKSVSKLQRK